MSRSINLNGKIVADDSDAYVIAEIGHNHQGDLRKCKDMFIAAKYAGADAVKLQKRNNRMLFTTAMFDEPYNGENAYAATYGAHREALEFGREEYVELQRFSRELGIEFFATAFDVESADFLEDLGMPFYKLASGDLTNIPLLKHVGAFGKPMILSTGAATLDDVRRAYDTLIPINENLAILQCTASYPCDAGDMNLRVIETFRKEFPGVVIGLSSHHRGISMPLIGYMLGARIIEAHFTLNRTWKGTDQAFSLSPEGFRRMVRDLHQAGEAMGDGVKRRLPVEEAPMRKMGKKLVAARALPAGHVLCESDISVKSPGDGLAPHHMEQLVGRRLNVPLAKEQALDWQHVAEAGKSAAG